MSQRTLTTRTIIGLEIHVQLRTTSKMFCGCPVRFEAPPNSCVCPVCLGQPGSLPVINRRAFELSVLVGLALNCTIARRTKWDRKSYYYPDMPKNYQITQYDCPLAAEGHFDFSVGDVAKRVRIKRAHLEEDAGKNIHDPSGSTLIDLNRAGTPLLEIVTEPDLSTAEEAFAFCVELQKLVTYLGASEGNMKKGQMRFEPNVNVAIECEGREIRTPIVEIKNLNSFRAVRDAIAYESQRQVTTWQEDREYQLGKRPNENCGWNAEKGITEFQRGKEAAHDYRYFPEPDLVPVEMSSTQLDEIRANLPELPIARRERFIKEYDLSASDAQTIVGEAATADLFEAVLAAGGPVDIVGKQFVNVWLKLANDRGVGVADLGIDATRMAELATMVNTGVVSRSAANKLAVDIAKRHDPPPGPLPEGGCPISLEVGDTNLVSHSRPPRPKPWSTQPTFQELAEELGLVQVTDSDATEAWVEQVFAENAQAVQDAVSNPKKAKAAAGFLRGQAMKISAGKADPKKIQELIERRLAER